MHETRPREPVEIHVWFAHRLPFLVAVDERDAAIGWTRILPAEARRADARVGEHVIHVAARARGGGVATELLRELCRTARRAGFEQLVGWLPGDSLDARAAHRAAGFVEIARQRRRSRRFGRGEDWVGVGHTLAGAFEIRPPASARPDALLVNAPGG